MTLSRQTIYLVGIVAAAVTAAALAAANFVATAPGDNGGGGEYAITLALSLAVAAAIFGWLIPRTRRPAHVGIVVGAIGLLSVAAFWSGLPYVLGPAAIVLGLLGRTRPEQRAAGTVAVALGALATAGALAGLFLDRVA
jgi:hypothetical protein